MSSLAERELVDEMLDAYVCWREERGAVWHAYECWTCAPPAQALSAFAAYQAALDQEERAGDVYAGLVMQVAATADPLAIDLIPK